MRDRGGGGVDSPLGGPLSPPTYDAQYSHASPNGKVGWGRVG